MNGKGSFYRHGSQIKQSDFDRIFNKGTTMKREQVSSGMIKSVGYDEAEELLQVEFTNGDVWDYLRVPKVAYDEMMEVASVGKYFHANIKSEFQSVKAS
jgi:hypothetical protein